MIPEDFLFILDLETNEILINENFAKELAKFKNLHVRVSTKGDNGKLFFKNNLDRSKIFFKFQLKALEKFDKI